MMNMNQDAACNAIWHIQKVLFVRVQRTHATRDLELSIDGRLDIFRLGGHISAEGAHAPKDLSAIATAALQDKLKPRHNNLRRVPYCERA